MDMALRSWFESCSPASDCGTNIHAGHVHERRVLKISPFYYLIWQRLAHGLVKLDARNHSVSTWAAQVRSHRCCKGGGDLVLSSFHTRNITRKCRLAPAITTLLGRDFCVPFNYAPVDDQAVARFRLQGVSSEALRSRIVSGDRQTRKFK